jgi:hypothetical protein
MLEILTILAQVLACVLIFVTGVLALNDLPRHLGVRGVFRALALVLVTGAAGFQLFRPTDPYVCVMLIGVALEMVTARSAWWRCVWHGQAPGAYRGFDRRRRGAA